MRSTTGLMLLLAVAGCGREPEVREARVPVDPADSVLVVRDTVLPTTFDAAGIAEPILRATLSSKLMGGVLRVTAREGDRVAAGQLLAELDAREVTARRSQVQAALAAARAVHADAETQAGRFRALYADSAATRYQLDQAETGLARAEAGLRAAEASEREVGAMGSYAEIRAPFAGIVTRRFVDPGAFLSPGAPVVELQDTGRLRISVSAPPTVAARLHRGDEIDGRIEGLPVTAVVEGVVPASGGSVYSINAVVSNRSGAFLSGGSAILRIPTGRRRSVVVPVAALIREGDLTGVRVRGGQGDELRWVRLGEAWSIRPEGDPGVEPGGVAGDRVEILSGLTPGDRILVRGS